MVLQGQISGGKVVEEGGRSFPRSCFKSGDRPCNVGVPPGKGGAPDIGFAEDVASQESRIGSCHIFGKEIVAHLSLGREGDFFKKSAPSDNKLRCSGKGDMPHHIQVFQPHIGAVFDLQSPMQRHSHKSPSTDDDIFQVSQRKRCLPGGSQIQSPA